MNNIFKAKYEDVYQLKNYQIKEIIDGLINEPIDNLVSIQLQEINGDPEWIEIYGVYTNTLQWVQDYYNSGGGWDYSGTVAEWLDVIQQHLEKTK